MRLDELAPSLAAMAKPLAPTKPGAASTTGGSLTGNQNQDTDPNAQKQTLGAVDIVNALKDPQVALQLKAMKQKMPGGNLDAMVDPKGAADQQKQIQDLSLALDMLKKNAGLK